MTGRSRYLALLAAALLAAGCGAGSQGGGRSATGPGGTTATATATAPPAGTATATISTLPAADPRVQQAVAQCKAQIERNPRIPGSVKQDIERICDRAATGRPQDTRQIARDVCRKIVGASLPAGAARDRALESCRTAGR